MKWRTILMLAALYAFACAAVLCLALADWLVGNVPHRVLHSQSADWTQDERDAR